MRDDSQDISSGTRGEKTILFVARYVNSIEVVNNFLVNDNFKNLTLRRRMGRYCDGE